MIGLIRCGVLISSISACLTGLSISLLRWIGIAVKSSPGKFRQAWKRVSASAHWSALRLYPKPDIFNIDQGAQFTGKAVTGVLKDHDIQNSMDGKGQLMDNIFIERLLRSVKFEEVYLNDYATTDELRKALRKYFQGLPQNLWVKTFAH